MNNKKQRGRPRTTLPAYPLQAIKMEQFFAYMKGLGQAETQGDLAPFFGLNSRTAFNKLFLGKKALNHRHKWFCVVRTGILIEWWDQEGVLIEDSLSEFVTEQSPSRSQERNKLATPTAEKALVMKYLFSVAATRSRDGSILAECARG